jgi:hypothetical protein
MLPVSMAISIHGILLALVTLALAMVSGGDVDGGVAGARLGLLLGFRRVVAGLLLGRHRGGRSCR